jgi:3-phenylpropionate/trans-cinnamate dioxygenase ferredoxin reductase subunit
LSDRIALLIVGGGPAGLSAARGYRAAGGAGRVAIVADEERVPYNRPPLTKDLLRGESQEAELPLEEEAWFGDHAVELIGGRAVTLEAAERTVTLSGGRELAFEQCVLATGAEPKRLPIPGADRPAVLVLRSLDHLRELQRRLGRSSRVAVIGSGFIGCEIASSLRRLGHPVSLISGETAPNAARLGEQAAGILRGWLDDDGVEVHLGAPLDRIERTGDQLRLSAGDRTVNAELVVMATGVSPRSELAAQAGLSLRGGAVPVSPAMRTLRPGLLAAGDVSFAENATAGRPLRVEHWGEALAQGEIAGQTAAGEGAQWSAVPGFWSTIGRRTLKYAAWGDGFDRTRVEHHPGGGFTVWYGQGDRAVGVLTHEADPDYERGRTAIAEGAPWS